MIPTPETGWHWKITPEQVKAIKANDREAINAAYFDNYQKFAKIGYNFCRRVHDYNDREDFLQQVYVDMPMFDYTVTYFYGRSMDKPFYYRPIYRLSGLRCSTVKSASQRQKIVAENLNIY